jgi:trans-2,3-dihydro-3-hydroxyanthranilate isomerase
MPLEFDTADVFTTTRFGGNPLAVVWDAEVLDAAAMQRIAREFNLSETVFVLAPRAPGSDAFLRIFTPAFEMPFAGHPNVGTAVLLARRRGLAGDGVTLDQAAGPVSARLSRNGEAITGAEIEAPVPFRAGEALPVAEIASCLGLPEAAFVTRHHPPMTGSCGARFAIVELADLVALTAATPDVAAFRAHLPARENGAPVGIHLYVRLPDGGLRARMFAPLGGVPEDPATGSANVALGGLLLSLSDRDALTLTVEQGVEMGRPSLLSVRARRDEAGAIRVAVGGGVVPVARGTIETR